MVYNRLPNNLPEILRARGLKVRELPGWKTAGRPLTSGQYDPIAVLGHHTASAVSSSDEAVLSLLVRGRSDLVGPLCQLALLRDGTVVIVASGRANHAGTAKVSGPVPAGDGNKLYIGIEAFNNGVGEVWPKVQMDAYDLLVATLLEDVLGGKDASYYRGHKESSVTGKIDPTFDMNKARIRVAAKLEEFRAPDPTRGEKIDDALAALKKAKGTGRRGELISRAKKILKKIKFL